jgi:hypothetical protein
MKKPKLTRTQWKERQDTWIRAQQAKAEKYFQGKFKYNIQSPTPYLEHFRSLIDKELRSREGDKCKYDKDFLWNDRFKIIPDHDEDIYLKTARKQYRQDPTLENYRIYWLAWKNLGYPGHDEGDCHGPECGTKVFCDYDGGYYIFCNDHNTKLYLEFCLGPYQEDKQKAIFEQWCKELA